MPAGLDSGAVLRALADHPDAFPALRGDIAEFARKAMVKQLKDKALTLEALRRLTRACGEEAVATVLDGWEASDLAGLAKKADAHGPHARAGGDKSAGETAAARRHLLDLAAMRAEPSAKVEKAAKEPKAPKPVKEPKDARSKIGGVLQSKVHSGAARPSRARKG